MQSNLIPEKTAARMFGLSVSWFQKRRSYGDGPPYYKIGGAIRYDVSELQEWMRRRCGHPGVLGGWTDD